MARVHLQDEIAASVGAVWELLRDFGGLQRWSPEVASCTLEGSGIGAVRTVQAGAFTVRERLETLNDAAHSLSYSIIESPIPFKNYVATMTLTQVEPQRTRLTWSSTFEPDGMEDAQLVQLVESIYRQGIAGIKSALAREHNSSRV